MTVVTMAVAVTAVVMRVVFVEVIAESVVNIGV